MFCQKFANYIQKTFKRSVIAVYDDFCFGKVNFCCDDFSFFERDFAAFEAIAETQIIFLLKVITPDAPEAKFLSLLKCPNFYQKRHPVKKEWRFLRN